MTATYNLLDHLLVAAILVLAVLEWRWLWPRHVHAVAQGIPGVREKYYRGTMLSEWLFTACVVLAWATHERSWANLGLGASSLSRTALGLLFAATIIVTLRFRSKALLANPRHLERLRPKMAFANAMLPATQRELTLFALLSLTAGVCEEFIFRGFVMWYFGAWMAPALAVLASAVMFGFGHIYQGLVHVPRTALVGVFLGFLVLVTGSLWPAIVIHAALDLNSGVLGFHIMRQPPTPQSDPVVTAEV